MLFEFDRPKSRNKFCLRVDGPINEGGGEGGGLISGGPIIGSLRYKRLSLNLAGFLKTLSPDGPFASNSFNLQSSYYKN